MKYILLLLFVFVLYLTVLPQSNASTQTSANLKEIVGSYTYSSGFVGATYKILDGGRYEYSSFSDCCDPVWREEGTIDLRDNLLHFKIIKKTVNNYNLLDPKEATEAFQKLYRSKKEVKAGEIETEYDLRLVRWGARIYLIPPEKLHLFVGAVNLGAEPRRFIINKNYLTTMFFLRVGDQEKAVNSKPVLPDEAISYLLDSPIKATITKIELQDKNNIYFVNKGSVDGLKIGMCLVQENTEPDYDNLLWVDSAEDHSAKLKSYPIFQAPNFKEGNVLTTKSMKKVQ